MTKKTDDLKKTFNEILGETLKNFRGQKTQEFVGSRADVSRITIGKWENGKSSPDLFDLNRVINVLTDNPGDFWNVLNEQYQRVIEPKMQAADKEKLIRYLERTKKKHRGKNI